MENNLTINSRKEVTILGRLSIKNCELKQAYLLKFKAPRCEYYHVVGLFSQFSQILKEKKNTGITSYQEIL